MDEALDRDDRRLLSTFLDASPDVILITDLETGGILEFNGEFEHATGYARAEAVGRDVFQLGMWADLADRERFVGLLEAEGRVRGFEARLRLKWGEIRLFQISSARIDLDGRACALSIIRDIQDRSADEERLRKAAFLLERAEEMAKIGSWEFDYAAKRVTGSPGSARIYGIEPGDLTVRTIEEVPLPEYRAALDAARDAHIARGEPYDVRFKIRRKSDGEILDVRSRALWDPANKRLFGILRDVTEETRAEAELKSAIAQRDALIRELYHRTSNTLQMVLSMLRLEEADAGSSRLAALVERVSRRVESIALAHESLYESRDLTHIDLAEYLRRLVEASRGAAGERGRIGLEYRLEDVKVPVDAAVPCGIIVEELVDDVLSHAFEGGGRSALVAARRDAEGAVRIEIEDRGRGERRRIAGETEPGIGRRLVGMLCEGQLRGEARFEGPPGFACRIAFKDGQIAPRV